MKNLSLDSKYQIKKLSEEPFRFKELIKNIEKHLGYTDIFSFSIDFYPLIEKKNWSNLNILIDKKTNQIIGHIGIKYHTLFTHKAQLKSCFVGGIYIDHKYQGKGLFKKLFNHVLSNIENSTALCLLWSDKTKLYNKFNFYECGQVAISDLTNIKRKKSFKRVDFQSLSFIDIHSINKLYKESRINCLRPRRTWDHYQSYKSMTSADLYLSRGAEGQIESYYVKNKGIDLQDIVYEWSSKNEDELETVYGEIVWDSVDKNSKGAHEQKISYLGFIKIHNFNSLKYFLKSINSNNKIINFSEHNISFYYKYNHITIDHQQFVTSLFGPDKMIIEKEDQLNIFISGLDSI